MLPSAPLLSIGITEDTLQFVDRVRAYVAQNADLGLMENQFCDTFANVSIEEFNENRFLSIFRGDSGTASCGLAGQLMVKILIQNGIDAYTYNFGFNQTMFTHIVVLVKHRGRYLIYDPFINYTLLDEVGNNMDLQRLLLQIAGDSVQVKFSRDTVQTDILVDRENLSPTIRELLQSKDCLEISDHATHVRDSVFKVPMLRCFDCESDGRCFRFVPLFERQLSTKTRFTQFHEGLAFKINEIYGAADHARVNAMVDSLIASLPELESRKGL